MKQQPPPPGQHPSHFWRLWGWPLALGLMTAVGLVSALFSDGGLGDALAWVTLGVPVGVCARYGLGRVSSRRPR
jgi:hypothetical protein